MRTTLTVEDGLARALKRIAGRRGLSFKAVVNEALRAGVRDIERPRARAPYRTTPVAFEILPGHDPYKLGQLADEDEDHAKMERSR